MYNPFNRSLFTGDFPKPAEQLTYCAALYDQVQELQTRIEALKLKELSKQKGIE